MFPAKLFLLFLFGLAVWLVAGCCGLCTPVQTNSKPTKPTPNTRPKSNLRPTPNPPWALNLGAHQRQLVLLPDATVATAEASKAPPPRRCRLRSAEERYGGGSKPMGSHFGAGAPPILEPILVGIGMFTGCAGF